MIQATTPLARARQSQVLTDTRPSECHHDSHAALLRKPLIEADQVAQVDAIIVPTVRPIGRLAGTLETARELGCPVVALCSGRANSRSIAHLGHARGAEVLAVDLVSPIVPAGFETSAVL